MSSKTTPLLTRINLVYKETLAILEREVEHIRVLGIAEPLPTAKTQDLIRIIKVLEDMKTASAEMLQANKDRKAGKLKVLTEDKLQELIKE